MAQTRSLDPLNDAARLIDWQIFNLLAGNSDGHGKNLSLLHTADGCRLAPFYDLVCTRAYPDVDRMLAMSIAGERDPGQIARRHWEAMAGEVRVGKRLLLSRVKRWCALIPQRLEAVIAELDRQHRASPAIERMRRAIHTQCRRTLHLLENT